VIGRNWSARRREESGAAAVEFALIFPIFALLAFGTIAAGFAFARQINITQAAREASRYGSTLSIKASHQTAGVNDGTISTWLAAVDAAAVGAAGNNLFSGLTARCVAYVNVNDASATFHSSDGGSAASGACPGTNAADAGLPVYVQVVLERDTDFNLIVTDPTITLDTISTTPFEAVETS
jgi:Flp pilus assembly protein TadG